MLPALSDKPQSGREVNFAYLGVYYPVIDDNKALKLVLDVLPPYLFLLGSYSIFYFVCQFEFIWAILMPWTCIRL